MAQQHSAPFLTRFLKFAFYLLYQPLAWSYDFVAWAVSFGRWKNWVYSVLPELRGPRVLEMGFGPGHLQVAMRNKGIPAFGIDRSPQMSHLTTTKLHRARHSSFLVRGEGQHMPFVDQAFEELVSTFPSEYILDPKTLSEVRRVLRPEGRIVVLPVAWITAKDPINRILAWLFRVTKQSGEWTGLFCQAFINAGFRVKEKRVKLKGSELIQIIATPISNN